jgi:hypothetical protein
MKSAGLKTTFPRNSTDHRSGLILSVARGDFYQVWWVPNAFGLIWKKEETLGVIRKENGCEDAAKLRILNRQLSVDFGTLLRIRENPSPRTWQNHGFQTGNCREFQNRVHSPVTGYFLTAFGALIGRP